LDTSPSITLTEVLPGDFNSSSAVDARDYLVYRQENGLLAPLMVNYETWKANYGDTVSNVSSIPEPATSLLFSFGMLWAVRWLRVRA